MKKKCLSILLVTAVIVGGFFGGNNLLKKEVVANSNENVSEEDKLHKDVSLEKEKVSNGDKSVESKKVEEKEKNYITKNINDINIPILMYHSISDADPNNGLLVPVKQFEDQMRWLKENGFTPMLMDDVLKAFNTGLVPEKPIAITFDDGYSDNYTSAYPIMKKYDMKGTFFVITDGIDDGYYMASSMLKEMKDNGMQIENHTSNHLELNRLSKEEQRNSIKKGKEALKEKLNIESKIFCYPVGKYNKDTIEVLQELGIELAVTTKGGQANLQDGNLTLDRIRMAPMSVESFASILQN